MVHVCEKARARKYVSSARREVSCHKLSNGETIGPTSGILYIVISYGHSAREQQTKAARVA